MVEALKKIDKKFLILAGCIILLPIILIIVLAIVQGCSNTKVTYEKYEEKMLEAAKSYFADNGNLPTLEGETKTIELNILVKNEYIKSTEDLLEDTTCEGSVTARLNGSNVEENEGGFINYTVNLECDDYKTNSLINSLTNDLVTEGSGLYETENGYIFKGDEVKNYITFFGVQYRIVSVDENGILKLLKSESESIERYWDIKYNIDTGSASGKNIYADSEIYKYLMDIYNNSKYFSKEAKKHVVSKNVCVGARDINDLTLNNNSECSNVLNNQIISLLGVTDYANASTDPYCLDILSKSCRNYNYMKGLFLDTWTFTPVSNNSYEVYYIYNGIVKYKEASKYSSYNIVIYIDGDEILESGNGSEKTPYIIK